MCLKLIKHHFIKSCFHLCEMIVPAFIVIEVRGVWCIVVKLWPYQEENTFGNEIPFATLIYLPIS